MGGGMGMMGGGMMGRGMMGGMPPLMEAKMFIEKAMHLCSIPILSEMETPNILRYTRHAQMMLRRVYYCPIYSHLATMQLEKAEMYLYPSGAHGFHKHIAMKFMMKAMREIRMCSGGMGGGMMR